MPQKGVFSDIRKNEGPNQLVQTQSVHLYVDKSMLSLSSIPLKYIVKSKAWWYHRASFMIFLFLKPSSTGLLLYQPYVLHNSLLVGATNKYFVISRYFIFQKMIPHINTRFLSLQMLRFRCLLTDTLDSVTVRTEIIGSVDFCAFC